MTFPSAILTFLTAAGLLLAPGAAPVAVPGDGSVTWSEARHGSPALVAETRVEARGARPADEDPSRPRADGDPAPPPSARPGCPPAATSCPAPVAPSRDVRASLAQLHRRVNGSADAHGARA